MVITNLNPGGGGKIEELEKRIAALESTVSALFNVKNVPPFKSQFYTLGNYMGMQLSGATGTYRLQFDGKTLMVFQYFEDKAAWENMGTIAKLQQ